jgi:hypothetical protein
MPRSFFDLQQTKNGLEIMLNTVLPLPAADLPVAKIRYRFTLSAPSPSRLWLGSTWRGIIGNRLKELVCPFANRTDCEQCTIRKHCPAALIIKGHTAMPGLRDSPRGYVVDSMTEPGSRNPTMVLTLFGETIRFAPMITAALEKGQRKGIFHTRTTYSMTETEQIRPNGDSIPLGYKEVPDAEPLHIWTNEPALPVTPDRYRFETPVRLKARGAYLDSMDWPFFFASLARRLEALGCLMNNEKPLGRENWHTMQAAFQAPGTIFAETVWKDLFRYSGTQKKKIPMGGLVGTFDISGAADWVRTWIDSARVVHVGKGAAMGLGRVVPDS